MNELSLYELGILSSILNVNIDNLKGMSFSDVANTYLLRKKGTKIYLANMIVYEINVNDYYVTWRKNKKTKELMSYSIS